MAKKLLVLTPVTKDGTTLLYDDNKQPIMKETIVELGAKKNFESLNSKLPPQLRHDFGEIVVPDRIKGTSNAELTRRLSELESRKEKTTLEARIAELEAQLAENKGPALVSNSEPAADIQSPVPPATISTEADAGLKPVPEVLEKIAKAKTKEAVGKITLGETRQEVIDAGLARIAELS